MRHKNPITMKIYQPFLLGLLALPTAMYADNMVPCPQDSVNNASAISSPVIIILYPHICADTSADPYYPPRRTPPVGLQIEQYGHLLVFPSTGMDYVVELLDSDTGMSVYQETLPSNSSECPVPAELQGTFVLQLYMENRIYRGEILLP